jgi:DNA-binding NtrC family response regulator
MLSAAMIGSAAYEDPHDLRVAEPRNKPGRRLLILGEERVEETSALFEQAGWDVKVVHTWEGAAQALAAERFHVAVAILKRFQDSDPAGFRECRAAGADVSWVALVDRGLLSAPEFRDFLYRSFFDYHSMPLDRQRLLLIVGHAYGMAVLAPDQNMDSSGAKLGIVGESPPIVELRRTVRKVAEVNVPVLITGESGTGKELIARAMHSLSKRKHARFIAVNCAALPSGLIQSELFGHERGSFTGAHQRKVGRVEAADGGTLFLDEIGDLPADLQVNLLRFLQEHTFERVGGRESLEVDVRVVAATNVDLEQAVEQGRFREDLFYRLAVVPVHAPPLRERGDDIVRLALYYFKQIVSEQQSTAQGFTQHALTAIRTYSWPGNVRELINRVRRAVLLCEGRLIAISDLELPETSPAPVDQLDDARHSAERTAIAQAIQRASGNISRAAKLLGVSRVTLYRLMKKHKLQA